MSKKNLSWHRWLSVVCKYKQHDLCKKKNGKKIVWCRCSCHVK